MPRPRLGRFGLSALCAAVLALALGGTLPGPADATTAAPAAAVAASPGGLPPTEQMPEDGPVEPLKNQALLQHSTWGYRMQVGQQDSNITITEQNGGLRYVDTGTREWKRLPKSCRKVDVAKGIGAWCRIPDRFADADEMFLEVWPRLGDDKVDGSTLSGKYRLWVLTDKGHDTVLGGDGADFGNGYTGNDVMIGGAGNDWFRGGLDKDDLQGQGGDDELVAGDQDDRIDGGDGDDKVYGGSGHDRLFAGAGTDIANCAGGRDEAVVDSHDRTRACEKVTQE